MSSIPLPALAIQQQPGPIDQYTKLMQYRLAQQQLAHEQALAPGQLQQQQQQIQAGQQTLQSGQLDLEQKQRQAQDQKLLQGIYQKNATRDSAPAAQTSGDGSTPTARPMPTGVDWGGIYHDAVSQGVSPQGLASVAAAQKQQLDIVEQLGKVDKAQRDKIQANNEATWNAAETIRGIPEGSPARDQAYQQSVQNLQQQGVDTSKFPQQTPNNAQLDQIEGPLGMVNAALKMANDRAGLLEKEQKTAAPSVQQKTDAVNTINSYSMVPPAMRAGLSKEMQDAPNEEALQKIQARADQANESFQRSADARAQAATMKNVAVAQQVGVMLVKQDEKLQDSLADTGGIRQQLGMGGDGNQTASSTALLRFAEHEVKQGGINRFNQTEMNMLGSGSGSWMRQMQTWIDKGMHGTPPAAKVSEINAILDAEDKIASQKHSQAVDDINQRMLGASAAGSQGGGPASNAGPAAKATHRYNPKTGQIEPI
jgi:hypothetical protein